MQGRETAAGKSRRFPLTAFEHFFVAEDKVDYPGVFFLRMTFTGSFDEERLRLAFYRTAARHPIMNAHLEGDPSQRTTDLAWRVADDDHRPYIYFGPLDAPIQYPRASGKFIDLKKETGVRLFVTQGDGKSVLLLQLHHSCADGVGSVLFMEDVLGFYHMPPGTSEAEFGRYVREIDTSILPRRGTYHLTPDDLAKRRKKDLRNWAGFFTFVPKSIAINRASHRQIDRDNAPYPATSVAEFSESEVKDIIQTAKGLGGSVNDLALRDLFLTVDQWNREHNSKSQAIRVGIPVNLRKEADKAMPVTNVVSMYFMDRPASQFVDENALFKSIHDETAYLKEHNMALAFVRFFSLAGRAKRLVSLVTDTPVPKCGNTTSLSNLGLVLKDTKLPKQGVKVAFDGVVLERVELLPPVRRHTYGTFGVATYNNKMAVTFHFDARNLSQSDADRLMALYKARILQSTRKH